MESNVTKIDFLSNITTAELIEEVYQRTLNAQELDMAISDQDRLRLISASRNLEEVMIERLLGKASTDAF